MFRTLLSVVRKLESNYLGKSKMKSAYDAKREQIKQAAKVFFIQYGYYKTTLEDIARHIGIKKNSLYYYFPNKETLFNELIQNEAEEVFLNIEKALKSCKSASQKMKVFSKRVIYAHVERSNVYSITLQIFLEIGDIIEQSYKGFRKRASSILENILTEGVKSGEFKKHNTTELSEYILTVINSLEYKEFRIAHIDSFDQLDLTKIEKTIMKILDYIIAGLTCKK